MLSFKVHLGANKNPIKTLIQESWQHRHQDSQVQKLPMFVTKRHLIAARKDKKAVDLKDFQDAIDRVIGGLEKEKQDNLAGRKENCCLP